MTHNTFLLLHNSVMTSQVFHSQLGFSNNGLINFTRMADSHNFTYYEKDKPFHSMSDGLGRSNIMGVKNQWWDNFDSGMEIGIGIVEKIWDNSIMKIKAFGLKSESDHIRWNRKFLTRPITGQNTQRTRLSRANTRPLKGHYEPAKPPVETKTNGLRKLQLI